jgi:hypothetical protein
MTGDNKTELQTSSLNCEARLGSAEAKVQPTEHNPFVIDEDYYFSGVPSRRKLQS